MSPSADARCVASNGLSSQYGFPFHFKVHRGIPVGRINARMSEPLTDGRQVNSGLKQMDGGTVTDTVRMNAF